MPATLKVKTWSGKYHYYFRYSAKALAVQKVFGKAYLQEKKADKKGELWSLRMNNAYGLGPGSVVTEDGKTGEYTIAWDAPIVEIPDSFLDFLVGRYEAAQSGKAQPSTALAVAVAAPAAGSDNAAPHAWKKPKGKKEWQRELNSVELIGEGERNSVLISIAGHLRHALKFDED